MECFIEQDEAELSGSFHLSMNENVLSTYGCKPFNLVLYNIQVNLCHLIGMLF